MYIKFLKMEETSFFIFLSSEDSLLYHQDNVPSDFIVELKERLQLTGDWEVGFCDFVCSETIPEKCFIFSDIVDYSYVRNTLEPILRTLMPTISSSTYIFPKIFYFPIKVNSLNRIRVYIKDNHLRLLSSLTAAVSVTLHFRKQR